MKNDFVNESERQYQENKYGGTKGMYKAGELWDGIGDKLLYTPAAPLGKGFQMMGDGWTPPTVLQGSGGIYNTTLDEIFIPGK